MKNINKNKIGIEPEIPALCDPIVSSIISSLTAAVILTNRAGEVRFISSNFGEVTGLEIERNAERVHIQDILRTGVKLEFDSDSAPQEYHSIKIEINPWDKRYLNLTTTSIKPDYVLYEIVNATEQVKLTESLSHSNKVVSLCQKTIHQKNKALTTLSEQVETNRRRLSENIVKNLKSNIFPGMKVLREKLEKSDKRFLDLLETGILEVTSPFFKNIDNLENRLSDKQKEICYLIKKGHKSSEIARICRVSVETINVQRKRIRKKLGITREKVNLRTFLKSLE